MKIIKRNFAGHTVQPVDFIEEGTVDKERSTLSGASASLQILTGAYEGIEITDSNGVTLILRTDTVTSTQIEPAAAVPFVGTTQDLKDLLKEFFFFDIGGGAADSELIDFTQRGANDTFYNPLTIQRVLQTSSTFVTGNTYLYPIYLSQNTEISKIGFSKVGLGAANLTMGIYDFEAQGNATVKFTPKNLIFQPPEFIFPIGTVKAVNSFPAFTFDGGWYCFVFNVSASWRAKGTTLIPDFWGYGELATSISIITVMTRLAAYTNVMPDPFPQTAPDIIPSYSNIIPPVPFFKK